MDYHLLLNKMPERIKTAWRKTLFTVLGLFLVIGGIGLLFVVKNHWMFDWVQILFIINFVFFILLGILLFALIPYRYHFHRYEISEEDVAFQSGWFFRNTVYMPINKIQHVEIEQGPFLRQENLVKIVIHTAAAMHEIAGLDIEEAEELRIQIIDLVKAAKEDV